MEDINDICTKLSRLVGKRNRLKAFLEEMPSEGVTVSYTIRNEILPSVINKITLNSIVTAALRSKLNEELQIAEEQIKGYLRHDTE